MIGDSDHAHCLICRINQLTGFASTELEHTKDKTGNNSHKSPKPRWIRVNLQRSNLRLAGEGLKASTTTLSAKKNSNCVVGKEIGCERSVYIIFATQENTTR